MHNIFTPILNKNERIIHLNFNQLIQNNELKLLENENYLITGNLYNYIVNVLRSNINDKFIIIDNHLNNHYELNINKIAKKELIVNLKRIDLTFTVPSRQYICFIANLKNNFVDELIEQLTELGVDHIYFFKAYYSQIDISDEKLKRYEKIALATSSQAKRILAPKINTITKNEMFKLLNNTNSYSILMVEPAIYKELYEIDPNLTKKLSFNYDEFYDMLKDVNNIKINIISGPEGGFNILEVQELLLNIKQPIYLISFNRTILKASFAPQVMLSILKYKFGDL